ncbi:MAG: hypothetical protein EOO06_04670 [Chitinophagaceae bacterium]|nr:MAG: hypothetical protein EOO06_04670 [Chitinophagaceae bacterium]
MLIRQLYRFNKLWFAAFILFICAFLYINLKWGYSASPVYQFGMFSGPYQPGDTQLVYRLYNGNVEINPVTQLNGVDRDVIYTALNRFETQASQNDNIYHTTQRFYKALHLSRFMKQENFQNSVGESDLQAWLNFYLSKRTRHSDFDVKVNKQMFHWRGGKMVPVDYKLTDSFGTNAEKY